MMKLKQMQLLIVQLLIQQMQSKKFSSQSQLLAAWLVCLNSYW